MSASYPQIRPFLAYLGFMRMTNTRDSQRHAIFCPSYERGSTRFPALLIFPGYPKSAPKPNLSTFLSINRIDRPGYRYPFNPIILYELYLIVSIVIILLLIGEAHILALI